MAGKERREPGGKSTKRSVAVAVFRDFDRLGRAVSELRAIGLGAHHIVIFASPDDHRLRVREGGPLDITAAARLVDPAEVVHIERAEGLLEWDATHFDKWIPEALCHSLRRELADRAFILFAEIIEDALGREIAEVLLCHSLQRVQFHEYRQAY